MFFSSDVGNPDTNAKFQADLQTYTHTIAPDPEVYMEQYVSWEIASKANKWRGRNISRWRDDEVDRLARSAESELDPVKRAAMFIRMKDLVVGGGPSSFSVESNSQNWCSSSSPVGMWACCI